jgi:predicted metal-dependent hydrolase
MKVLLDAQTSVAVFKSNRRRSASITVENGVVSAFVPHSLTEDQIERLVLKKTSWIKQKLHIQSSIQVPRSKEFIAGEAFSYLGRTYRLRILEGESGARLKNGYLEVTLPRSLEDSEQHLAIRRSIIRWYQDHAHERLQTKTIRFKNILGVEPKKIVIKDFKTKWGSCSQNGEVSFNWRIVMAPNRVMDYIVVHELSHLINHDHSVAFWKNLRNVIPDYELDKDWLRVNSQHLFLF